MLSLSLLYGNSDLNGMEETRSIGSDSDSVLEANLSQNQVKTCLVSRDNHSIHFFRERACTFRQKFNTYKLILVGRCILSSLSWIIFYKKKRRDGSNGSLLDSFRERARTFRQRFEYNKTDTIWMLYSYFIILDDLYKKKEEGRQQRIVDSFLGMKAHLNLVNKYFRVLVRTRGRKVPPPFPILSIRISSRQKRLHTSTMLTPIQMIHIEFPYCISILLETSQAANTRIFTVV